MGGTPSSDMCTTSQYLRTNGFVPFWHQLQYDMLVHVPVGGVGGGGGGVAVVVKQLVAFWHWLVAVAGGKASF